MTTEESIHPRGLQRFAAVGAVIGVASAVAASVLHFGFADVGAARTLAFVGMIGAFAAGVAAVTSRSSGQKAVFAIIAVLCLMASSTVFGMTFS